MRQAINLGVFRGPQQSGSSLAPQSHEPRDFDSANVLQNNTIRFVRGRGSPRGSCESLGEPGPPRTPKGGLSPEDLWGRGPEPRRPGSAQPGAGLSFRANIHLSVLNNSYDRMCV